MKNHETNSTIVCPKCKSSDVTSTISFININTGLKVGKGSFFWGLIFTVTGAFLIILGIINWNLPEANPGLLLGGGILLFLTGIQKAISFIFRKQEKYFYHNCNKCSHKWTRLGSEGDIQAIRPFIDALEKDDSTDKENILKVMENIQDSRFIEPLRKQLNSTNTEIRILAFSALCAYKKEGLTLDEILEATKDNEKRMREIALETLGGYKSNKVIEYLIFALDDKSINVRAEALISLKKVTGKKLANDTSKWKAWWEANKLSEIK